MRFSKDIKEYYKILDNIVTSLFKSKNHTMLKTALLDKIKKENFVFIDENIELSDDILNKQFEEDQFENFLEEVITYLKEKGFIYEQNEFIRLTFKGIIQHSKGFVKTLDLDIKNSRRMKKVEKVQKFHIKWTTRLTFLIAFGTLVAAIFYVTEIISHIAYQCK